MLAIRYQLSQGEPITVMHTHRQETKVVKALFNHVIPHLQQHSAVITGENMGAEMFNCLIGLRGHRFRPLRAGKKPTLDCMLTVKAVRGYDHMTGTYKYLYSVQVS